MRILRHAHWAGALALLAMVAGCAIIAGPPTARIELASAALYVEENATFDASSSSGSGIIDYAWDFGNGMTASGREVSIAFTSPGHYTATLTVTDSEGRSGQAALDVTVYVRSGTRLFFEDFSDGTSALGRWSLDPTWASANDGWIEEIEEEENFALAVDSGEDRWHRRHAPLSLPPIRDGQRVVFRARVMTLQTQRSHTFAIVPLRKSINAPAGSLPYFEFSSDAEGSFLRQPTPFGSGTSAQVPFLPSVYRWHDYAFVYTASAYELWVDDILIADGPVTVDFVDGGTWFILLGEESSTEACSAYFDDIEITIEE